jgi:flavodoxin
VTAPPGPDADRIVDRPGDDLLVVVHSATGRTAQMGRAIADALGADFVWLKASTSPAGEAVVEPGRMDLAARRLLILGSPIWYGTQTKYINAFVDDNDIRGKSVVLFNTDQGNRREDFPGIWMERIVRAGGRVIDHVVVTTAGKTAEQVNIEIAGLIVSRKALWLSSIGTAPAP